MKFRHRFFGRIRRLSHSVLTHADRSNRNGRRRIRTRNPWTVLVSCKYVHLFRRACLGEKLRCLEVRRYNNSSWLSFSGHKFGSRPAGSYGPPSNPASEVGEGLILSKTRVAVITCFVSSIVPAIVLLFSQAACNGPAPCPFTPWFLNPGSSQ